MTGALNLRPAGAVGVLLVLLFCLQGCSLFSLESPAKPLPRRDLNARMLTRDYAQRFSESVALAADDIAARSADPDIQLKTLQWKSNATTANRRAATQIAPMISLLDTWAFSAQMREFLGTGAGSTLFGDQQSIARNAADTLETDIQRLAASLAAKDEYASYAQFVDGYVRDHPLTGLDFARASVLDLWVSQTGQQATLLSTLGTAPEAMSDMAERMRLYGDQLPEQALWQAQLAVRESGYRKEDLSDAMQRIDGRLAQIASLAETSPEQIRGLVAEVRTDLLEVADRFDRSWINLLQALRAERVAFTADFRNERAEMTSSLSAQRAALMQDADHTLVQLTEAAWGHLRTLMRELALWAILALVIVLGLPFVAGYYVGRARSAVQKSGGPLAGKGIAQ